MFNKILNLIKNNKKEKLSQKWGDYLKGNSLAEKLWGELIAIDNNIPIPAAMPFADGLQFVWDKNEHHLEIDIFSDFTYEWFYRNRKTEEMGGSDTSIDKLPNNIIVHLNKII